MSEPASPLEPRDVALLRDARDAERPPPEVHARVRARLAASVGIHGPDPGNVARQGSAAVGSALSKATIAVTALLIGGAGGASLYAKLRPLPPPKIIYVREPGLTPAPPPASPPPPSEARLAPPTPVVNVARPIASASSSRTVQLAAERVLLDEARGALVQGDPTRALDRLAQHRRTFATAILGEERDAMEVEALAKADRSAEAKAKADTFRRRMPNSLFLPAVESAVESIP